MLSGKKIMYITLLAIIGVLIYYFFYKKKKSTSSYVGPQDCAENCNLPYHNHFLLCYKKYDGGSELNDCLGNAERMRQDCLGKCDKSLPPYKDLSQIISTPIQED